MNDDVTLTGHLEGVHRFENQTTSATGQVIGLTNFSVAGQDLQQTWLRAGASVEGKLGSGIASATIHGTTGCEAASYWLALNYRWQF
jgi:hypothetical protein